MEIQNGEMLSPLNPHFRMELIRAVRNRAGDWATLRITKPPKNAKHKAQVIFRINYRTNAGEKGINSSRMAWYVVSQVHTLARSPAEAEAAIQERIDLIRRFLEANAYMVEIQRQDK